MSVDETRAGKSLKRYCWLVFVIAGMVVGFVGCLISWYANGSKNAASVMRIKTNKNST